MPPLKKSQLNFTMIIFQKSKKIFIAIPKTGSTTILSIANSEYLPFLPNIYHSKSNETKEILCSLDFDLRLFDKEEGFNGNKTKLIEEIDDFTIVAAVREPVDRLKSLWIDIQENLHPSLSMYAKYNFTDFVKTIIRSNTKSLPIHAQPQYLFIGSPRYKEIYNFKYYSNMVADLFPLRTHSEIPRLRDTRNSSYRVAISPLGDDLINEVKAFYKKDYVLLNNL